MSAPAGEVCRGTCIDDTTLPDIDVNAGSDSGMALLHDQLLAGEPNRPLRQEGHREHHDQLSAIGVSYFTQEVSSLGNTPAVLPKALGPTFGEQSAMGAIGETMTANEPDAETWQRLFASLVGDAAVDAATIREFCNIHGLTPDRILKEMQARRQLVQPQE